MQENQRSETRFAVAQDDATAALQPGSPWASDLPVDPTPEVDQVTDASRCADSALVLAAKIEKLVAGQPKGEVVAAMGILLGIQCSDGARLEVALLRLTEIARQVHRHQHLFVGPTP